MKINRQIKINQENWGICDIDYTHCFGKGAICKQSPTPQHFTFIQKGQGKKEPLRNNECSHYKKSANQPSENEKEAKKQT